MLVVVIGSAGVALLGAGLAPAAVGSLVDALVVGVALAIGAPVAAVTSMVIAGVIVDAALTDVDDLPGTILRRGIVSADRRRAARGRWRSAAGCGACGAMPDV